MSTAWTTESGEIDPDTEYQYAEMAYDEMRPPAFGYTAWKRMTEDLIGRKLEPTEANEMYDMIDKARRLKQ